MSPASPAPVFANIAFLRIPHFDARPIVEQAALKERLEARVRKAIAAVKLDERVVLDAADGIALVLFVDATRALDIARALSATPGEETLQVGLNHGPIAVTGHETAALVFGDGIAAAAAAARFAAPGHLLVSAPFATMLEATRPDRAAELAPAGEYTDARVRLHAFFTLEPQRLVLRRNQFTAYALAGILGILLLGVAGREVNRRFFPPRPAVVAFDVKPRGEVLVDGLSYGRSPPLTDVELPRGKHRIQVRNGNQPPLDITVFLEPGEHLTIAHNFAGERTPPKVEGFWRNLRRRMGL
jgi:hypothetical protein